MSMTGKIEHVEVITSVQRRRRWSAEEKAAIVQQTYAPGSGLRWEEFIDAMAKAYEARFE